MSNRLTLAGLTVLFFWWALSGVGLSQPQGRGHRGTRFGERLEVLEKLELTVEQHNELTAHYCETPGPAQEKRSRIEIHELDLDQLMKAVTVNEEAIQIQAREIGELKSQQYQDRVAEKRHSREFPRRSRTASFVSWVGLSVGLVVGAALSHLEGRGRKVFRMNWRLVRCFDWGCSR